MSEARPLRVLYVGPRRGTCLQRAEALASRGHELRLVDAEEPASGGRLLLFRLLNRLGHPPDLLGANRAIRAAARAGGIDVLWVDKGRTTRPGTLGAVRRSSPRTAIVAYSPDDMLNPANQSARYRGCISRYDLHVTTKSYNVAELAALGARDVLFVDNAYDPAMHRPVELSAEEHERYRADCGFIGGFEGDRAEQLVWLAASGVEVTVWGYAWEHFRAAEPRLHLRHQLLDGLEYAKSICATRINLGFLRKVNRDLQTTRSIEIPACGGFLLAERTDEHRRLFEEGREAEFFAGPAELLQKCRYYLEHEPERLRIAQAGRRRCLEGRYSNAERLDRVVDHIRRHLASGNGRR